VTPAERRLWRAIQRRVVALTPTMNKAILDAFANIVALMSETEMILALANADTFAETVLTDARMRQAFIGVRAEIARQTREAALWFIPQLPQGGAVDGVLAVGFNILNPNVIEAIRKLDSRVMVSLRDDLREGFRATVRQGLTEGVGSRTIARRVRQSVGLAPNQLQAVTNFHDALAGGDFTKALGYELRDKRFDATLKRLRAADGSLTAKQINTMTSAYRRKFIAWNAKTVARTAVNDAQRLGKHLATQAAIDAGILDGSRMFSRWVNSGDSRVREEHQDAPIGAGNTVVRFGEPFETGEVIPGEDSWNCRCIKVDFEAPRAVAAA